MYVSFNKFWKLISDKTEKFSAYNLIRWFLVVDRDFCSKLFNMTSFIELTIDVFNLSIISLKSLFQMAFNVLYMLIKF